MSSFFDKNLPPGMSPSEEQRVVRWGLALSLFLGLWDLIQFFTEISNLYQYRGRERVLDESCIMPDFAEIFVRFPIGFLILAVCMLGFVTYHYIYYYRGSKSIYLMRRLPNRFEIHRRAWTYPFCVMLLCALCIVVLFWLYFGLYLWITPNVCLEPGQLARIWA